MKTGHVRVKGPLTMRQNSTLMTQALLVDDQMSRTCGDNCSRAGDLSVLRRSGAGATSKWSFAEEQGGSVSTCPEAFRRGRASLACRPGPAGGGSIGAAGVRPGRQNQDQRGLIRYSR